MTPSRLRWPATVALLLALLASASQLMDNLARDPVDQAFSRALVTFTVVRAINAVVSVVQGTELAIEPAGVGVILTPGEVFDPVNDLIERFSWIMLASSTSLGAQKVLIELSSGWVMQILTVAALLALFAIVWTLPWLRGRGRSLALHLALLTLFVRFAVPGVVLINNAVYEGFLDQRYQDSHLALKQTRDEVEALQEADKGQTKPDATRNSQGNIIDRLGRWYDRTAQSLDVEARIETYKDRLARASEHIIQLIVVFMLQTVVFPLLFLWLGLRLLRALVNNIR